MPRVRIISWDSANPAENGSDLNVTVAAPDKPGVEFVRGQGNQWATPIVVRRPRRPAIAVRGPPGPQSKSYQNQNADVDVADLPVRAIDHPSQAALARAGRLVVERRETALDEE